MKLEQLALACDAFAAHHLDPKGVPLHHLRLVLEVVMRGGRCTYQQLQETLDLTNSSVSRTVNALGSEHRNGKPGLGLLTTYPDPDEGRRFVVTLTPKGTAFLRQLQTI